MNDVRVVPPGASPTPSAPADPHAEVARFPVGASPLTRVRIGLRCLRVLANDPANTYYGPLLTVTLDRERFAQIAAGWRAEGRRAGLLDERPTLQGGELDLAQLAELPDGTLGREVARYFEHNALCPFVTTFAIETDVDYLCKRYRETHDLFHVLTGYATDEPGEMELQAFALGNLGVRHAALILAFSVPRQAHAGGLRSLPRYLRSLRAAHARGRRSPELLSARYESLWALPLTQVRAELGLNEPDLNEPGLNEPDLNEPARTTGARAGEE